MSHAMAPTELARLLAWMQAGDVQALDVFARAYGPRLLAVARRRCRCAHDVEDAVQDALLQARRSMTGYRGDGSPLAWLSTLVARSCYRMNERADVAAAGAARAAAAGDSAAHGDCACTDPAVLAERRALGERIGAALMSLSRTDRLAFVLAVEGCSSDEIGERFGLTSDAVRSRLKRARARLRALLSDPSL